MKIIKQYLLGMETENVRNGGQPGFLPKRMIENRNNEEQKVPYEDLCLDLAHSPNSEIQKQQTTILLKLK